MSASRTTRSLPPTSTASRTACRSTAEPGVEVGADDPAIGSRSRAAHPMSFDLALAALACAADATRLSNCSELARQCLEPCRRGMPGERVRAASLVAESRKRGRHPIAGRTPYPRIDRPAMRRANPPDRRRDLAATGQRRAGPVSASATVSPSAGEALRQPGQHGDLAPDPLRFGKEHQVGLDARTVVVAQPEERLPNRRRASRLLAVRRSRRQAIARP